MNKSVSGTRVSIIGTGNVGFHLARQMAKSGCRLVQVAGRNRKTTSESAERLGCSWTTNLGEMIPDVDLLVLAVNDRNLEQVIGMINPGVTLVVHTAGAVPISVFSGYTEHYGVLYPLQTFSRDRPLLFEQLPFCIEANTPEHESFLSEVVRSMNALPVKLSSEKRASLHLSAVFVNNFVNHFYVLAKEVLDTKEISFEWLHPLIRETIEKMLELGPENAQTGPAVRNEENVIKKHLELLSFSPELEKLYSIITDSIRYHSKR